MANVETSAPSVHIQTNFSAIPLELQERDQWVCWKLEERDGKPTKVPYHPGGRKAKADTPRTWSSFDDVVEAEGFDGIGYVFSANDPYVGIDIDNAWSDGPNDLARDIIKRLGSYTELSQSGTGVHVICRGELPKGGNKTGWNATVGGSKLELYDCGRFFCMTGHQPQGAQEEINEASGALQFLWETYGKARKTNGHAEPTKLKGSLADLERAFTEDQFAALMEDDLFRKRWSLKDTGDPSREIMKIMCACCLAGEWTDEALAGLYIRFYRRHKPAKLDRNGVIEFVAAEVSKAREYAKASGDQELNEFELLALEVGPLAAANEALGLKIDKVTQHGQIKSDYYLEAYGHTIRIGKAHQFLNPTHVGNMMFDVAGKVMRGMKRHEWAKVAELLKQAAVVEKDRETEDCGALWHALAEYFSISAPEEASYEALTHRNPVLAKGWVYIHKMKFQEFADTFKVKSQMSVSEWMKSMGFEPRLINRRNDRGDQASIRYHGIPMEVFRRRTLSVPGENEI